MQLAACIDDQSSVEFATSDAGWSSLAARRAHNPKVVGSNPAPATKGIKRLAQLFELGFLRYRGRVSVGASQFGSVKLWLLDVNGARG